MNSVWFWFYEHSYDWSGIVVWFYDPDAYYEHN
jgi:hypothetical protein